MTRITCVQKIFHLLDVNSDLILFGIAKIMSLTVGLVKIHKTAFSTVFQNYKNSIYKPGIICISACSVPTL